jgi:hypothetical protein
MFASNVYLGEGGVTGENRIKELIAAMPVCLEADAAASAAKKVRVSWNRTLTLPNPT